MSVENLILELLNPLLEAHGLVLVEMHLPAEHRVDLFVDGEENVSVEVCAAITRALRHQSGESLDAWQITVSSPGLDKPFRHPMQFQKNIGKSVEVLLKDGQKLLGVLKAWNENSLLLALFAKAPGKGAIKPPLSGQEQEIDMPAVKAVKKAIFFS